MPGQITCRQLFITLYMHKCYTILFILSLVYSHPNIGQRAFEGGHSRVTFCSKCSPVEVGIQAAWSLCLCKSLGMNDNVDVQKLTSDLYAASAVVETGQGGVFTSAAAIESWNIGDQLWFRFLAGKLAAIVYSRSFCRWKLGVEHVAFDVHTNTMRILSLWVIQLDSCPCVVAF